MTSYLAQLLLFGLAGSVAYPQLFWQHLICKPLTKLVYFLSQCLLLLVAYFLRGLINRSLADSSLKNLSLPNFNPNIALSVVSAMFIAIFKIVFSASNAFLTKQKW
jgi:hypothetical protein